MTEGFYEKMTEICKKRSIIYPSAEIYGGLSGFYDYGSLGVKIKNNFISEWRQYFLKDLKENFVEIDPCIVAPEDVFQASGHLENFNDPVLDCSKCNERYRADHFLDEKLGGDHDGILPKEVDKLVEKNDLKCPSCKGNFKSAELMNLMFSSDLNAKTKVYFRPETTQGPVINFKREYLSNREQLPLGIAVIGKVFRNEISARQGLFRVKEFTQAEVQIFNDPEIREHPRFKEVENHELQVMLADERKKGIQQIKAKDMVKKGYMQKYVYFMAKLQQFAEKFVPKDRFRFYEKSETERAFYNKYHFDLEFKLDSFDEFKEIWAIHYRTDHDLKGHQKVSGKKLTVSKDGKKFLPHIIELTFGVDRSVLALLDINFREGKDGMYFAFPKEIAPYRVAVFPLVKKDGLKEKAEEIYDSLRTDFEALYDESGSIGRRYARTDEIGVPIAITVDYDTLKDDTVTIRDRDTQKQKRVKINEIRKHL